jgi:hypothetical protein
VADRVVVVEAENNIFARQVLFGYKGEGDGVAVGGVEGVIKVGR